MVSWLGLLLARGWRLRKPQALNDEGSHLTCVPRVKSNLTLLCSQGSFPTAQRRQCEKPRGGRGPVLAWLLTGCTQLSCPCSGSPGCTGSDGDSHPASGGEVSRAHASHTAAGSHLDTRILGESAGDTHSRSQAPT